RPPTVSGKAVVGVLATSVLATIFAISAYTSSPRTPFATDPTTGARIQQQASQFARLPMSPDGPATKDGFVPVPLREMIELDGKTREEVLTWRSACVVEHPELLARFGITTYSPMPAVFGGIEDNRPWWGILGLDYFGDGPRASAGPSEESRFLGNPYLLV